MSGDLAFAHALADAADAITIARFRALDLRVETKPDLTPVSEADRAAEEAIRDLVAASRRGRGRARRGVRRRRRRRRWIVDPIDGTKNYVRGVPVWATLLALEREGEVEVGARVGAGARPPLVGGARRRRVRRTASAAASRRSTARGRAALDDVRRAHAAPAGRRSSQPRLVEPRARRLLAALPRRRRRARHRVRPRDDMWDYAPVQLLVEEAGGRCTTFDGEAPAAGASFVSTNGVLHAEAVSLLGA